jgi:hypothetical protein
MKKVFKNIVGALFLMVVIPVIGLVLACLPDEI